MASFLNSFKPRRIETVPNTAERVLVWDGDKWIVGRADDWHAIPKPHWLADATHWTDLPEPPE